jgi:hypothetical protein
MRARTALIRTFEKAGFTLVRCNKHAIMRCPCGHTQVSVPTTPGYGRSASNTTAELARTLRACRQKMEECA